MWYIRGNGLDPLKMGMESKFGQIVQNTLDLGYMDFHKEMEYLQKQMEISYMEIGIRVKYMDMPLIIKKETKKQQKTL